MVLVFRTRFQYADLPEPLRSRLAYPRCWGSPSRAHTEVSAPPCERSANPALTSDVGRSDGVTRTGSVWEMSIGAGPVSELELAIAHGEQERAELTAGKRADPTKRGTVARRTLGLGQRGFISFLILHIIYIAST